MLPTVVPPPVISVDDTLGNFYSSFGVVLNTGQGVMLWTSYVVCGTSGGLIATVNYSSAFLAPSIGISEFHSTTGWGNQVFPDGYNMESNSFGNAIQTGPITTTNPYDLLITTNFHGVNTLTLPSGWTSIVNPSATFNISWMPVSVVATYSFSAGQSTSGPWAGVIWSFQSPAPVSGGGGPIVLVVHTSAAIASSFPEVYPNRIPEDVYDSLVGHPNFVFVRTGPSYLNI